MADAAELLRLEISYFNFKRLIWFESMTLAKTKPVDNILNSLHSQFQLQNDEQRFSRDIVEASRLASAVQAQYAAEQARFAVVQAERIQKAQDRTNTSIEVVTALLAPVALCYTGAAVLLEPSENDFWAATLIGVTFYLCSPCRWMDSAVMARSQPSSGTGRNRGPTTDTVA